MGAVGNALASGLLTLMGFQDGGRIIPSRLMYKGGGFANRPDEALTMPQVGFRRGGRIMKGTAAMKKKMAKLRAMKKRRE
jgi:hypothetical protein